MKLSTKDRSDFAALVAAYIKNKKQQAAYSLRKTVEERKIPHSLECEMHELERAILAHPDSFGRVRTWMVDVIILTSIKPDDVAGKVFHDAKNHEGHKWAAEVDNLSNNVHALMSKYLLTDSSCGMGNIELGCSCTEDEAKSLIGELHKQFGKAIKSGYITIKRHPWSMGFKE